MPHWGKGRKLDFIQSQKIRFYSKSGSFLSGQGFKVNEKSGNFVVRLLQIVLLDVFV